MSREIRSCSSPFGPFTRTSSGSTVSSTPEGMGMGCLPMRDTALPDLRDELAADAGAACVVAGHEALGGRNDHGAHAADHARNVLRRRVGAAARLRHAAQARDDGGAA